MLRIPYRNRLLLKKILRIVLILLGAVTILIKLL